MADSPSPIDIQKALGGISYPASREDLVNNAENSGADDSVLEALRNIPDQEYESPADVSKAVSG
ncbi:DUF2795 domain-containing protein [Arthrobacter sp. JZ12]|uniref:DUF2795 domain-containing protein n=1 Tax=Arthrobacter sp. JZ12 TaxID=2654190 RepID=UPI002B49ABD2|nr:DUF2795 domain-containing protein [Arthrobacter sp. JZ12]WRH25206.1 DUF2795 domain-containing protein [Arthrobacter sp. JZ12]